MELTRRKAIETGSAALAMGTIAGCTGGDSNSDDDPVDNGQDSDAETDGTPGSEPGDGEDQDSSPDSDTGDEDGPAEHSLEFLAETVIDHEHACLHAEFDERTPLDAGGSAEAAPVQNETHVMWDLTYEGDAGYVGFDATQHEQDESFVFYTAGGSATPVEGTEIERTSVSDDDCSFVDEFVRVEPDNGAIVLKVMSD